jgi:hypothetical protein
LRLSGQPRRIHPASTERTHMRYVANGGASTGEPGGAGLLALVRPWRMISLRRHRGTNNAVPKTAIAERSRQLAENVGEPCRTATTSALDSPRQVGRRVRGLRPRRMLPRSGLDRYRTKARDAQRQARREIGRQRPPLHDTGSPEGLGSNILSNILSESRCKGS